MKRSMPSSLDVKDTTDDGLTWLDPDGTPPELDAGGRLLRPFVVICVRGDHYFTETYAAGMTLPRTPKEIEVGLRAIKAERVRRRGAPFLADDQLRVYHAAIAALHAGTEPAPGPEPEATADAPAEEESADSTDPQAGRMPMPAVGRGVTATGTVTLASALGDVERRLNSLGAVDRPATAEDHRRVAVEQEARALAPARRARGKLSPADVADIRERVAAGGETNKAIAASYGVDGSTISDIKNGRYHRG